MTNFIFRKSISSLYERQILAFGIRIFHNCDWQINSTTTTNAKSINDIVKRKTPNICRFSTNSLYTKRQIQIWRLPLGIVIGPSCTWLNEQASPLPGKNFSIGSIHSHKKMSGVLGSGGTAKWSKTLIFNILYFRFFYGGPSFGLYQGQNRFSKNGKREYGSPKIWDGKKYGTGFVTNTGNRE